MCVEVYQVSIFNMVLGIQPKAWAASALPPELFYKPRNSYELRVSTKEGEINKTASLIKGENS